MSKRSQQTPRQSLENIVETHLYGNRASAFLSELLTNSGHFLILKTLSDLVLKGWLNCLTDPTEYLFIAAMLIQTWYLSRPSGHRFYGNLIGAMLYTLIDAPIDGLDFFQEPSHITFLVFSAVIAVLQGIRYYWWHGSDRWVIPLESMARTIMLVALYIGIGLKLDKQPSYLAYILSFPASATHQFLIWSVILVGLLLGFQALQIATQRQQLQTTAQMLRNLAEWGMGSHVVNTAVTNPSALNFQSCDRTIVFMDIRSFTAWCEQTKLDVITAVLNDYYRHVEPAAARYQPLRITFTGDEIMAIYATPEQGVAAALAMRQVARDILAPYGIGAGCAVHRGLAIEGLFGSEDVRTYSKAIVA